MKALESQYGLEIYVATILNTGHEVFCIKFFKYLLFFLNTFRNQSNV